MEDFPVDVCISYPEPEGIRQRHFFTSSVALLGTLREWKQLGRQDIMLTWGRTKPIAVDEVRRQLLLAEIECGGVRSPDRGRVSRREALLLTFGELASVLGCLAAIVTAAVSLLLGALRSDPGLFWIVFGSTGGFLYSAAMFVVFNRVKRSPVE